MTGDDKHRRVTLYEATRLTVLNHKRVKLGSKACSRRALSRCKMPLDAGRQLACGKCGDIVSKKKKSIWYTLNNSTDL